MSEIVFSFEAESDREPEVEGFRMDSGPLKVHRLPSDFPKQLIDEEVQDAATYDHEAMIADQENKWGEQRTSNE
jgi:hypothetical protein